MIIDVIVYNFVIDVASRAIAHRVLGYKFRHTLNKASELPLPVQSLVSGAWCKVWGKFVVCICDFSYIFIANNGSYDSFIVVQLL